MLPDNPLADPARRQEIRWNIEHNDPSYWDQDRLSEALHYIETLETELDGDGSHGPDAVKALGLRKIRELDADHIALLKQRIETLEQERDERQKRIIGLRQQMKQRLQEAKHKDGLVHHANQRAEHAAALVREAFEEGCVTGWNRRAMEERQSTFDLQIAKLTAEAWQASAVKRTLEGQ